MQYACRKTLADSRPRVRGRFAKNDEFGESIQSCFSNHGCEEDVSFNSRNLLPNPIIFTPYVHIINIFWRRTNDSSIEEDVTLLSFIFIFFNENLI